MLPISPMIEEMFTIRPEPRSIMCGSAAWLMKNAPDRLTASTLYQSSSVIFRTVLSIVIPALLTRMSRRPCWSITSPTVRRQSSADPMLPWWRLPFRPLPVSPLMNVSAVSWSRLEPAATSAPCSARLWQIAAPIPRVPPVTNATRPCKRGRLTFDSVGLVATTDILSPNSVANSMARATGQPVRELGPDLMFGLRTGHQTDVSAWALQVGDVLARDQIKQWDGAGRWGDVVRVGCHHEQVLLDPPQVHPLAAQPH